MKVKLVWQEQVVFHHTAVVDVDELREELEDHTDTDWSDLTPEELVNLANKQGVGDIFMADRQHDGDFIEVNDRQLMSAELVAEDNK